MKAHPQATGPSTARTAALYHTGTTALAVTLSAPACAPSALYWALVRLVWRLHFWALSSCSRQDLLYAQVYALLQPC